MFGTARVVSSVYRFLGGTDPGIHAKAKAERRINDLPVDHNSSFASVVHPTLRTAIESMIVSVLVWPEQ